VAFVPNNPNRSGRKAGDVQTSRARAVTTSTESRAAWEVFIVFPLRDL
jgi:hypothetical protein